MLQSLSGATRLYPIVGDPIGQVRSPAGVTAAFAQRGVDAICMPMHIAAVDFASFMATMRATRNVDGIIVTVPHKLAAFAACDTTSARAGFLRAVNTIVRMPDGGWHGDMLDGLGFVAAAKAKGCVLAGRTALLVGAGGAGTAIAHAVLGEGARRLYIVDKDQARLDRLVALLVGAGLPAVAAKGRADPDRASLDFGSVDVETIDNVFNATPLGMRAGDPMPIDAGRLQPGMFVGDVVTEPAVTPLIAAARARGCASSTGRDMFEAVRDLMVDVLLAPRGRT